MPQLDIMSFFPQFFWLCIFYFGFYLSLVKYFLPKMSRILKIRQLKMNTGVSKGVQEMKEEHLNLQQNRDLFLLQALKESRQLFQESSQNTQVWLHKVLQDINKNQGQDMNKAYLQSISDLTISQGLIQNNFKTILAPVSYKASGFNITSDSAKDLFFTAKVLDSLGR